MSRGENRFSRKSHAISRPSPVFGDFARELETRACPSSACSGARKDSAAKSPAWDGSARQSALRKAGCIPLPIARRDARTNSTKGMALANESIVC